MTPESTQFKLKEEANAHVARLHRFLPFSPIMEQIYEEYTSSIDSLDLETKALSYLLKVVKYPMARLIVLTGDAGHGKTHLCRRLLEVYLDLDVKTDKDMARTLINTVCDGRTPIHHPDSSSSKRPLRIYKDFSELAVELAAEEIEKAMANNDEVTVICANEGRLRAILESINAGKGCSKLLSDFTQSFADGLASRDGRDHIINLNFQSVASSGVESLLARSLRHWVHGGRWKVCEKCASKPLCPIYRNRSLLSHADDETGDVHQRKLIEIFSTIERLGIVVTIREMLMALAFLLTGGLTCADVHKKLKSAKKGWQPKFAFYNLLFAPPSKSIAEKLTRIPVVLEISRLDPGLKSTRAVDERLINEHERFKGGEIDIVFVGNSGSKNEIIDASKGIDEIIGNPRNRAERQKEADFVTDVVRSLRRRLFFDEETSPSEAMKRMGFKSGGDFIDVLSGELSAARMAALKKRFIAGLHMIQGLRMGTQETILHLVDPAFGNATSHAAIIARRIPSTSVKLLPMSDQWSAGDAKSQFGMIEAVDWLNRHVIFRVEDNNESQTDFALDLMMFDCVLRASGGYVAEEFYAHDLRKISNFLGRLAERMVGKEQEIALFMSGRMHSVSIDDGVIQVGGGH